MKSTFRSIMFIAAAAVTFSACNVEPIETPEESIGTHKVTFLATQDDTKTTMDIHDGVASFSWEEADEKCFYVYENGTLADLNSIEGDIDDNGLMKITAKFEDGATAPFTYTGFFAPTFSTYPQVPSAQTDAGKYDPKADILVAKPITIDVAQGDAPISFQFKRIVAINKMTIRGLSEGETVSSVKITSDKPIAGKYDYTKGEWYNSTDTQITVTASSQANSSGETVVFFVCAPVDDAQLSVTVKTTAGKTYYKKLSKTISFTESGVKFFSVEVAEPAYVKVNSEPSDWSGEYLLVYDPDNGTPLCWTGVDVAMGSTSTTIVNGKITTAPDGAASITITPMTGGYSIKVNGGTNDGKYIGMTKYDNGLAYNDNPILNTLAISQGAAVITGYSGNDGSVTMRFNSNSDQQRFRYYKSGQKAVQLYKYNGPTKQNQTLSFPASSYEIKPGESFSAPTVSGAQTTVTYSSNNPTVAEVNSNTGAVKILSAGKVIITATAVETDDYRSASASYSLTITSGTTKDYIYTFTSKSWAAKIGDKEANWSNGKEGAQLTSGQGIQVTEGASGANGTSDVEYVNVSKVVVKYCTNASKGAGSIKVNVGDGTEKSFTVTKPSSGGTTLKDAEFTFSPSETGKVKITVNCTTNSIYIYGVTITAQ